MASRNKTIYSVITIVIVILDIAVSWLNVHEIYGEIVEHQGGMTEMKSNSDAKVKGQGQGQGQGQGLGQPKPPPTKASRLEDMEPETCLKPEVYWTFILVFESLGTIFALLEIYYIWREMQKDKQLQQEGFRRAFVLVVLLYVFSVFPTTILEILYRDDCVCNGMYMEEDLKHWKRDAQHAKRDARRNVRELSKSLLDGVSVILLQALVFVPEVYALLRRTCDVCNSIVDCCKMAVPDVSDDDDNNNGDDGNDKGRGICFLTGLVLSMTFVGLFIAEILYIFCIPLFW